MAGPRWPSPNSLSRHLQDTQHILRAALPSCLPPPPPPSCFFLAPLLPGAHCLGKLAPSQSVGHCYICPGGFNFGACARVCSAGTFFAASRVSPFKKNSNQTPFPPSSSSLIPLSLPLSKGLTHLFVLPILCDMCLFPRFYPLFHVRPFSSLSSCCVSCCRC